MKRRQFIISGLAAGTGVYLTPFGLKSLPMWTSASPLRIGIIGLGQRGSVRVAECCASQHVQLHGLCDIDRLTLASTRAGLRKTSSLRQVLAACRPEEIFSDPKIDAVSIAVPVDQRAELVKQACKAGKYVLVEAPWAATDQESADLAKIASLAGVVVQQAPHDPDWNDEHFNMYVAGTKTDLKNLHLNIFVGANDNVEWVLHPAVDLLGAADRWLNAGPPAKVSVVADHSSRSATVRVDYQENRQMVFMISRTHGLATRELRADIESCTTAGHRERFVISTANLDQHNDSELSSAIDSFAELASSHRAQLNAADTHARNCFIRLLNKEVEGVEAMQPAF